MTSNSSKRDFINLLDYSSKELNDMIDLAIAMKKNPEEYRESLKGQTLAMIFTKNSTRTRISFQTGIYQLGGQGLFLGANDLQLSRGESIEDTAKVLSRFVDGIMIRTHAHSDVVGLAQHASVPVINGLTDYNHPCQVMADIQTIKEKFGKTQGLKLCYLGDGNNMTVSLVNGCMQFGIDVNVVSPNGYTIDQQYQEESVKNAADRGTKVLYTHNVEEGATDVDIIVTDTWISMGQTGGEQKLKDFAAYQVNDQIMAMANKDAIFMHCLPAHRDEEVATSVIDGPQSVVFDEAENRLHAQKAVMYNLMKK